MCYTARTCFYELFVRALNHSSLNFTCRMISSYQEVSLSKARCSKLILHSYWWCQKIMPLSVMCRQWLPLSPPAGLNFWDFALERGACYGTTCSLAMLRLLSLPTFCDSNWSAQSNCTCVVDNDSCFHFLAVYVLLLKLVCWPPKDAALLRRFYCILYWVDQIW